MTTEITMVVTAIIALAGVALAGIVAYKSRRAVRDLWHQIETLRADQRVLAQDQLRVHQTLAGEIAGLVLGRDTPVRFTAQHGEDIALWDLFDRKPAGFFVEVGAFDGVTFSNTYAFESIGWRGVLVEANPELCDACRRNRPKSTVVHAAVGGADASGSVTFHAARGHGTELLSFVNSDDDHLARIRREGGAITTVDVPFQSIGAILDAHCDAPIDFMTIDVEGSELAVLEGLPFDRFAPRVLVVENNSGGTDHRVRDLLSARGYELQRVLGCNELYMRAP